MSLIPQAEELSEPLVSSCNVWCSFIFKRAFVSLFVCQKAGRRAACRLSKSESALVMRSCWRGATTPSSQNTVKNREDQTKTKYKSTA